MGLIGASCKRRTPSMRDHPHWGMLESQILRVSKTSCGVLCFAHCKALCGSFFESLICFCNAKSNGLDFSFEKTKLETSISKILLQRSPRPHSLRPPRFYIDVCSSQPLLKTHGPHTKTETSQRNLVVKGLRGDSGLRERCFGFHAGFGVSGSVSGVGLRVLVYCGCNATLHVGRMTCSIVLCSLLDRLGYVCCLAEPSTD